MPRPKRMRLTQFEPRVTYFKPRGIPLRELAEVVLLPDELEAIKLHDVDGLPHIAAAKKMAISQPTFSRILNGAYKKITQALVLGKAIRIESQIQFGEETESAC